MEKEFVPYELALALKELGFDEPCFAIYEPQEIGIMFRWVENQKVVSNKAIGYVIAPLHQQAFRWFREKHELIACPMFNRKVGYRFEISINGGDSSCSTKFYGSLEEAELECLKKLIQIVKDDK
jgi:hypothetical protein